MTLEGRVAISARALERTVGAIAAGRLGVGVRDVSVRLTDDAGLLAIEVSGPVRIAPLRSTAAQAGVLSRLELARDGIRDDVTRIAGSRVGTVSVSITRAVILSEKVLR